MSAQTEMGVSIYWEPPEAQANIFGTFKYTVIFEGGRKTKEGHALSIELVRALDIASTCDKVGYT